MNYHCPRPPKQRAFDTSLLMWRRRFLGGAAFSPADLFASGEDGGWYDPSDLTSMFQGIDGSGGNPSVGDQVGVVLDKSQMGGQTAASFIAGQTELVTNGTFDSDTTGWTAQNGAILSVSNGQLVVTNGATSFGRADQSVTIVNGSYYLVSFDIIGGTASSLNFRGGTAAAGQQYFTATGVGSYRFLIKSVGTTLYLASVHGNVLGETIILDNISVKELPGNHLVAPALIQRPILRDEIVDGTSVDVSGQPELVTNGTFDTDITGWGDLGSLTAGSAVWNAGQIDVTVSGFEGSGQEVVSSGALNKWYIITFDALDNGARVYVGQTSNYSATPSLNTSSINAGSYTYIFRSLYDKVAVGLSSGSGSGVITYDNISIREVPASAARRYYLDFDGVDDQLETTSLAIDNELEVAVAVQVVNTSNKDVLEFASAIRANTQLTMRETGSSVLSIFGGSSFSTQGELSGAVTSAQKIVCRVFGTDNDFSGALNGAALFPDTSGTFPASQITQLTVAANNDNTFQHGGNFYGIVFIDRALTTAERQNLEIFLANKSGATLAT